MNLIISQEDCDITTCPDCPRIITCSLKEEALQRLKECYFKGKRVYVDKYRRVTKLWRKTNCLLVLPCIIAIDPKTKKRQSRCLSFDFILPYTQYTIFSWVLLFTGELQKTLDDNELTYLAKDSYDQIIDLLDGCLNLPDEVIERLEFDEHQIEEFYKMRDYLLSRVGLVSRRLSELKLLHSDSPVEEPLISESTSPILNHLSWLVALIKKTYLYRKASFMVRLFYKKVFTFNKKTFISRFFYILKLNHAPAPTIGSTSYEGDLLM